MRNTLLWFSIILLPNMALVQAADLPLDQIRLPPGFRIEVVARVENAREMALGAKGTLFVGSTQAGKVYAVNLESGRPAKAVTIASGLKSPVGVAFRNGALYVSAIDRILRLDDIEQPFWPIRRSRRSSATASPSRRITAGSSSPSALTESCTFRSARHATSASPIPIATPISCA